MRATSFSILPTKYDTCGWLSVSRFLFALSKSSSGTSPNTFWVVRIFVSRGMSLVALSNDSIDDSRSATELSKILELVYRAEWDMCGCGVGLVFG